QLFGGHPLHDLGRVTGAVEEAEVPETAVQGLADLRELVLDRLRVGVVGAVGAVRLLPVPAPADPVLLGGDVGPAGVRSVVLLARAALDRKSVVEGSVGG